MTPPRVFIALDIGGTKIAGSLVDERGSVQVRPVRVATPVDGDQIVATAIDLARTLRSSSAVDVAGIGVATAGVIDVGGSVIAATDTLRNWVGQEVSRSLCDALGLPAIALNDVHATAMAEHALGAGRGTNDALVVAVGTGIGGAIISRGRLVFGRTGTAGSVAHVPSGQNEGRICACGGIDHLEAYASGPGMARTYRESTGVDVSLETIADAAHHGDNAAVAIMEAGGRLLGSACAALVAILDPDVVIVGGGVAQAGSEYWTALQRGFIDSALPSVRDVPIRPAVLGVAAPLVGAVLAAAQFLDPEKKPLTMPSFDLDDTDTDT